MAAILRGRHLQIINVFAWELLYFDSNFTEMCPKGHVTISLHWFREWAEQATSQYLNKILPSILRRLCPGIYESLGLDDVDPFSKVVVGVLSSADTTVAFWYVKMSNILRILMFSIFHEQATSLNCHWEVSLPIPAMENTTPFSNLPLYPAWSASSGCFIFSTTGTSHGR